MHEALLARVLGIRPEALGVVDSVRLAAGALYVYSEADTADLETLDRSATYLRTVLDVWCWRATLPKRACRHWELGVWAFDEDLDPDFERHDFRVPDAFQRLTLADMLMDVLPTYYERGLECSEALFRIYDNPEASP